MRLRNRVGDDACARFRVCFFYGEMHDAPCFSNLRLGQFSPLLVADFIWLAFAPHCSWHDFVWVANFAMRMAILFTWAPSRCRI